MSSKVAYLNPDGKQISATTFASLLGSNPDAWTIRRYENNRVRAILTVMGRIFNVDMVPQEHWMRFELAVWNIVSEDFQGNPLPESKAYPDTDASGKFRTREEALAAYERFLAKHTECEFDTYSGEFIEEGNKFVPPSKDRPTVVESSPIAQDFGSW